MADDHAATIAALRDLLGERLTTSDSERSQHGRDESAYPEQPPHAVAYPTSTDEVAAIVRTCAEHGTPVVPFGAGSSLEGHVLATSGGVTIDMTRMDRILAVNAEDLDVTVQAGVHRRALADHLGRHGLFFSVDPGADATLGGMAATAASGTTTVRYGTMRENVLALEVVLADGRVIRTGTRARKSSAGYDLTHLFVGSEGTLGVITELTLRVHGIPEAIAAAVISLPSVTAAVDTAIAVVQSGIPVARCELLDPAAMAAVNAYAGLDEAEAPTLFLEFHGTDASVAEQAEAVGAIAAGNGGGGFRWTVGTEGRNRLWRARHDAYYAALAIRPGARSLTTDVCVPVSALADCIDATLADIADLPFPAPIVGHVADGNFHTMLLVDPEDDDALAQARGFVERLTRRAIALGGTCTGEHGIGMGKRAALVEERGDAVATMRTIKQALDPAGILNPGKILFPETEPARAGA